MEEKSEDTFIATAMAAALGTLGLLYVLKTLSRPTNLPPKAPIGMWETIQAVSGSDAPWFLLRVARKMEKCGAKIFSVPIPSSAGFYVVSTADLQRQVMLDRRADKPRELYGKFEAPHIPSGIFTRTTSDPIWKSSRKGAAPAFPSLK